MLQPFAIADAVLDAYRRYVRSGFPLRDPGLDAERERLIDVGLLWAQPHVALARPGTTGPKLASLDGLLDPGTLALPWGFEDLYAHQHRAIERLVTTRPGGPANTLVLSGTGSGKTESFLIPIVDSCLRNPGQGVKAIVLYPMNALANDQLKRLGELLGNCPEVSFGRYTGDAPEVDGGDSRRPPRPPNWPANGRWSRQAMRDDPPDILLTNYTQLEYLLLRRRDAELFRFGPPRYLVVDEIHLFTGVLGAEVACLLRRFRAHSGAGPGQLCAVGTSATAGVEEEARLLDFAQRFFGVAFDPDGAIAETATEFRPRGPVVPPPPCVTQEDLAHAHTPSGLAALATKVLGRPFVGDESLGSALGELIDQVGTVSVVERALHCPAPISAAALALGALPERAGVSVEALEAEATGLILVGAAAHQGLVGEDTLAPRFRPRVHQVVRSLAGLWRCLDSTCGHLARPGTGRCECGARTIPLASCRTCGHAYWASLSAGMALESLDRLTAVDGRRDDPRVFLGDPVGLELIDSDEDGNRVSWQAVVVCPHCAAFRAWPGSLVHDRACPRPRSAGVSLLGSTDAGHCPSCGSAGAGGRPILLPLQGSAAASVAVLSQATSDELRRADGEAAGRLLVFADSRQDAAQQAGYADDQGARVAVRQLLTDVLGRGPMALPYAARAVCAAVTDDAETLRRWLIGESERRFEEVAAPEYAPSSSDEDLVRHQLEWEVVLESTERSRRRFALEQEGLLVVSLDRLDDVVTGVSRSWPGHPFGGEGELASVVLAVVDSMRYRRMLDHWMLARTPRALSRNHHVRVGDRAVAATRGYGPKKYVNGAAQLDIRAWTLPRHVTQMAELIGRVLSVPSLHANEAVETLADRLHRVGLLSRSMVESRSRFMVDHRRIILERREVQPLWRCNACGVVRSALLTSVGGRPLCLTWRCAGQPARYEPRAERDYYRTRYLAPPRRLIVREHSGQIEGEERLALEEGFNNRSHPSVDVLACTPTLEVGVSLDDLHAVVLRNLPPTPANYAQRVGRAGRRSKVALALAHAGSGPHDSYFFERPADLIAGEVRAPAISLDNEALLRRHVNSLILESIGLDLPSKWIQSRDEEDTTASSETVADQDGVLREAALEPFAQRLGEPGVRAALEAAVRGAFASPLDPSPPGAAERVCAEQVAGFLKNLRSALNRWCDHYRALLNEYSSLRRAPGVPTKAEQELEGRLERELERLAAPRSPEYQPLGFLGMVGFLPRYGFVGESVLLHPSGADEPVVQRAWVAVTEFAPDNVVYARGRKLKVTRLHPAPVPEGSVAPDHRDNVLRDARRCDPCEMLFFDPLVKSCTSCGADLVTQRVVELTGVRGGGGTISSDDEYRTREDYDTLHMLTEPPTGSEVLIVGGLRFERTTGREVVMANRGLRSVGHSTRAPGFTICTGCGHAGETQLSHDDGSDSDAAADRGHWPRCPGRKDRTGDVVKDGVWLTARLRGDVLEIGLPPATRAEPFTSWRVTLAEALLFGVRETMQAGARDLGWFVRPLGGEPQALVIYDTMPGGTGYLPKLLADHGAGLRAAAAKALERLEGCACQRSCHRCLREFWNQRVHIALDRFEVLGTLRRLVSAEATSFEAAEDDRFDSFLEQELFERLGAAGLPVPTLQVVRELGGRRITVVDAEYRDPNVSVFLDGRAYHAASVEKIADDLHRRNRLEARGVLVLEFTYADVMARFEHVVVPALKRALSAQQDDPGLNPGELPGLVVLRRDDSRHQLEAAVAATEWVTDESRRAVSLASANRARLAGWRLERRVAES